MGFVDNFKKRVNYAQKRGRQLSTQIGKAQNKIRPYAKKYNNMLGNIIGDQSDFGFSQQRKSRGHRTNDWDF